MSKNRSIPLPPYVETAIKQLESHGFQAWCVGGCVRDSLLGNTPHDWDIATSALPEETLASFPGQRLLQTGISHGTITLLPAEGTSLEITTFRTESGYSDNRHPDQVRFSTSLEEDLSRRDFTVNAMAYHPVHGIVDPFGGQRDLEQKTLRAVGDPCRRFAEDALRILRGLRLASQLCFTIESHTSSALVSARHLLQSLSPERVQGELTKLLCGPSVLPVLQCYASVLFPFCQNWLLWKAAPRKRPITVMTFGSTLSTPSITPLPSLPCVGLSFCMTQANQRQRSFPRKDEPISMVTLQKVAILPGKSWHACGFPKRNKCGSELWWTTTKLPSL